MVKLLKDITYKNIISRIRWNVVIPLLLFISAIISLFIIFNPFAPKYNCLDGICTRLHLQPESIPLNGESTILVEIRNVGIESRDVDVLLWSDDTSVIFTDTQNRSSNDRVTLAPGNSRELDFDIVARHPIKWRKYNIGRNKKCWY